MGLQIDTRHSDVITPTTVQCCYMYWLKYTTLCIILILNALIWEFCMITLMPLIRAALLLRKQQNLKNYIRLKDK